MELDNVYALIAFEEADKGVVSRVWLRRHFLVLYRLLASGVVIDVPDALVTF